MTNIGYPSQVALKPSRSPASLQKLRYIVTDNEFNEVVSIYRRQYSKGMMFEILLNTRVQTNSKSWIVLIQHHDRQ